MKLTDKTLEAFENWYIDLYWGGTWAFSDAERLELYKSSIFNTLPESMKFGVYVDFFDSVGIWITIDTYVINEFELFIHTMTHDFPVNIFNTRHEARTAAITKADQLYNEQNYPD